MNFKEIKINITEYGKIVEESCFKKGDSGSKRLNAKSLNAYLNKELSAAENIEVRIMHKQNQRFELSVKLRIE